MNCFRLPDTTSLRAVTARHGHGSLEEFDFTSKFYESLTSWFGTLVDDSQLARTLDEIDRLVLEDTCTEDG